jgi:hypothetical protein
MILTRKTKELGEKPVPVPLSPPQIPHGLTWTRSRASAVRSRGLTPWAMARPSNINTEVLVNVELLYHEGLFSALPNSHHENHLYRLSTTACQYICKLRKHGAMLRRDPFEMGLRSSRLLERLEDKSRLLCQIVSSYWPRSLRWLPSGSPPQLE